MLNCFKTFSFSVNIIININALLSLSAIVAASLGPLGVVYLFILICLEAKAFIEFL